MDKKIAGGANPHGLVSDYKKIAPVSYQAPTKTATEDLNEFCLIGELTHAVLLQCFTRKYNVRPALAAVVFELSQHGRAA